MSLCVHCFVFYYICKVNVFFINFKKYYCYLINH